MCIQSPTIFLEGSAAAFLLASLFITHAQPQTAQTGPPDDQSRIAEQLSDVVEGFNKSHHFSGVVLAEINGEVIANVAVGGMDDSSDRKIDQETLFEIGSATKPITALTVLILQRQGKLSIDDPIDKYLPNVPKNCQSITIRHLLQHTSGIPGTNYGPHTLDVSEVVKAYLRGGPKHKPGTNHEYWNQGYALLSAVIAKASGVTYTDAVKKLVFEPAKMKHSCFTGDDPAVWKNVATGKSGFGEDRSALEHPYGSFYGLQYQGMGGIVSNVGDMLLFVQALRKSKKNLDQMLTTGPTGNYGLGWRVEQIGGDQRRVSHGGSVRGFLASVVFYPDSNRSLIILANSDDKKSFFATEAACQKILELALAPEQQKFDERFIESIVGDYVFQAHTITVSNEGQQLVMVIDWGGPKTYGKLEKRSAKNKLVFLDGSPEKHDLTIGKIKQGKIQSLRILKNNYIRK